ncbi:MAG: S-layer homology domain-containing protein [Monoglobaceae bacterium]
MKKFLCGLLSFIFISCSAAAQEIPSLPIATQLDIQVSAELPVDDIMTGDIVYADIALSDAESVYAFEALVEYDEGVLSYMGFESDILDDNSLKIEVNDGGRLRIAASAQGEYASDKSKRLCTITFAAKHDGGTKLTVKSVTAVFDDMTYMRSEPKVMLEVNIKSPSSNKGSGSGGGGKSGGGISVGGSVTSSAASVSEKPELPQENDVRDSNSDKSAVDFFDVDSEHWAFSDIKELSRLGVICGYEDGSFKPDINVTRAEFTKLICSVCNFEADGAEIFDFSDVKQGEWYFGSVSSMASHGIVNGNGGLFRPDDIITREDAAVILKRCLDARGINPSAVRENINFKDEADISDYAVWPIDVLYTAGLISGDDMQCFNPRSGLTRAEAAAMTARFNRLFGGAEDEVKN